jgi:hypothetical protein
MLVSLFGALNATRHPSWRRIALLDQSYGAIEK